MPSRTSLMASALLLIAAGAAALDAPPGVVAVRDPERTTPGKPSPISAISTACGGAAVIVGGDGLALTLGEVVPAGVDAVEVVLPGGAIRPARVEKRGAKTGAVLLRIDYGALAAPAASAIAAIGGIAPGEVVWTAGNSFGVIERDGQVALSRGVVSGLDEIASDTPPVRGRLGRILSDYRGPVIETDAAINDGNQGGPLLDDAGHVIGLVSLGLARERRLGTAVPIDEIVRDVGLKLPAVPRAGANDVVAAKLAKGAATAAPSIALLYLERPNGLGNPEATPRPAPLTDATPLYDRERIEEQWDRYYHDQQVFYTDQPVSALVVGDDLLLTSASNLHGDAKRGRVLIANHAPIEAELVARDRALDLALFRAASRLPQPRAKLAEHPELVVGDPIALVGRHRLGLGHTLTTGVVSATQRRRDQSEIALIQCDALANYGNLGGPVVDLDGRIVGLVAMLGPNPDWPWLINSGVALFVDSDAIRGELPALIEGKDRDEAPTFGLGVRLAYDRNGARLTVAGVVAGMGAAKADLQEGDVLLTVDGVAATSSHAVTRALLKHRMGDTVPVVVRRGDREMPAVPVELCAFPKEKPDEPAPAALPMGPPIPVEPKPDGGVVPAPPDAPAPKPDDGAKPAPGGSEVP